MKKLSQKESKSIKGGVSCAYCRWSVSGSSCSSWRAWDIHMRAWHAPTHKVRTCS